MEEAFGDIEGAEIIVDDLVVWGRNDEEHDKRLEQALERALKSGLKLNRKKCKFSVNRITYVGHIFSSNGLEPNPERVEAIVDLPEPNSKEELATFMGMITYLGKFVQNLSAVSAPLRELTQKGVTWSWEARHQEAFSELKQRIANAPTLKFYDVRQLVIVSTDGYSPAEMLSSRLLRSRGPTAASLLKPHVVPPLQKNLQLRQAKHKFYHDRKSGKQRTSLQSGDPVRFINSKGKWEFAKVKEEWNTPRSYVVEHLMGDHFAGTVDTCF